MRRAEGSTPRDDETRFYHEVQVEMLRYAAHIVGSDEASDVVGDAFVKFFAQRERHLARLPRTTGADRARRSDDAHEGPLGRDARLRLLKMVHDEAIDRRRDMERHERMLQLVSDSRLAQRQWTKTSLRTNDGDIRQTIMNVLATLPPYLREAWLLAREHDLDIDELAEHLGAPVASCRVYLSRANQRLERRLTEIELTPKSLRGREVE
ncbi:MAG: hypothetical protein IT359_16310 [Gemmatimonadaceae bacterium]|nr:hypothetical protein [Gemmatimonadaceae bacterium]